MIDTVVVLGATGDLTGRLLLPALAGMHADGRLDARFRLLGAGPEDWTTDGFADHARRRLAEHAPTVRATARDALVDGLRYRRADVTDPAAVASVLEHAGPGPVAVYLALPTALMIDAVRALPPLPAGSRVAVEKPFGQDAAGAVELNAALAAAGVDGVYRVDRALAMTVAVVGVRRDRAQQLHEVVLHDIA